MPIVPIYLDIDEKTYAGVKTGVLELCGLAKNANNKRVAKHIPAVADATKEGASKAIDFVRLHQKRNYHSRWYPCRRRHNRWYGWICYTSKAAKTRQTVWNSFTRVFGCCSKWNFEH